MEKKIQYSLNLLSMLFLAFTVVSAQLEAVYENGQQNKLFNIGKPLSLACKAPDSSKITWKRDGKNVNEIDALKNRYQIFEKEGRFLIERAHLDDDGNYTCHLDGDSKSFYVSAKILVKIPENTYVVEGDKLEINCIVKGTNAVISWHYSNGTDSISEITADERVKIEEKKDEDGEHVEASKLIIDHVLLSDKGTYYCNGSNPVMDQLSVDAASSDGLVRIKGKLAALWPFLGICAEVFILCAIILIYEKRRNKTDLDESDTDQSPDQKNDYNKDSDVRQRK
ncbi:unnamed protein product [Chironomus riparius]|uniref:Ig-like domain-containing protein n=1 Tax=Chironomus riparius TaxID=315576 RepID=A0A9N9WVV0_9DIPT|nr:unnamed protein product [Chironomus riparius]